MVAIKDENRILNEAVDHLNTQINDYENEIRTLKEANTKQKRMSLASSTPSRRTFAGTPNRSVSMGDEANFLRSLLSPDKNQPQQQQQQIMSLGKSIGLEAALFRPALHAAKMETIYWRHKFIESTNVTTTGATDSPTTLEQLPPLCVWSTPEREGGQPQEGNPAVTHYDARRDCLEELQLAQMKVRLTKASVKVVDLTQARGGRGRDIFRRNVKQVTDSLKRLECASERARRFLVPVV
jgi:hypothetical protein